jgi:hypothetical protein
MRDKQALALAKKEEEEKKRFEELKRIEKEKFEAAKAKSELRPLSWCLLPLFSLAFYLLRTCRCRPK